MKYLLKGEQLIQLAVAILALGQQPIHFAWWLWLLLFFAPDLSMAGYGFNSKVGAVCYNLVHHKATAGALIIVGFTCLVPWAMVAGLLLWAHSSFDRVMGYGLKYDDSFNHTHLGWIGKH
jgi:Domain of unknown function (DUF4260)